MKADWRAYLIAILALGLGTGYATTFLQFDSTSLGDGWFQYHMQVANDPFFTEADISGLSINFTNQIDQGTTTNWANSGSANGYSAWQSSQSPATRPYDVVFLVRSSETAYRLATNNWDGAVVVFSLMLAEFNPMNFPTDSGGIFSQNIVGYANMPCLVPCRPEDADGSPASFSFALKLLPDVNISQLVQSNGIVQGVDFLWDSESTFLLQGSTDLNSWTNIAYVWSEPPETVWTTNQSLNNFGQFFRVSLVANGHATGLPPLDSNSLLAKPAVAKASVAVTSAVPRVSGCQISGGKVAVTIATQANQNYTVRAMDKHKTIQAAQSVTATGTSASVSFDPKNLPTPVYFQVAATP